MRALAVISLATLAFTAACADVHQPTGVTPDRTIISLDDDNTAAIGGSIDFNRSSNDFSTADASVAASNFVWARTVSNTDYVSAGVGGLRNAPTGTITLSGVSGTVTRALLVWHGPTNTTNATLGATVTVNGTAVTGVNLGFSDNNCWGFQNSQGFAADVTSIVAAQGNGAYNLLNFGGYPTVNPNGASLLVFFDDGNGTNNHDVAIFLGNDSNINNPYDAPGWNIVLPGINYTSGSASLELHVADGQAFNDDALILNGQTLAPIGPLFDGNTVPGANNGPTGNGRLWDIRSFDISSFLTPGPNTLTMTTGVNSDCLALVAAAITLPVGAGPQAPPGQDPLGGGSGAGGCSRIFWARNPNAPWIATGLKETQKVNTLFNDAAAPYEGMGLLQALRTLDGGAGMLGGRELLLREGITAVLNASIPAIGFSLTKTQVMTLVNTALASGNLPNILRLAEVLRKENNKGCPFSQDFTPNT